MNAQATAVEVVDLRVLADDSSIAAAFVRLLKEPAAAKVALTDWEFKLACEAPLVFDRYGGFTWKQRRALRQIAKKVMLRHAEEMLITRRRNRITKNHVSLEFHPLEDPTCRWTTICDTHSTCCGHETRKLATYFLSAPWEWCEECREIPAVKRYLHIEGE